MKLKANKFSDLYSAINNIIKLFLITNYYETVSLCASTNDFSKYIYVVVWLPCYKLYIDSSYT